MRLIELKATKEFIDVKKGGLITYDTDQVIDQPGIILTNNPSGDYGLMVINPVHHSGPVKVTMRPLLTPAKKYAVNDVIGYIAVF